MTIQIKARTVFLKMSRKQFYALEGALDSVNEGTGEGAYMDVVRLYKALILAKAKALK